MGAILVLRLLLLRPFLTLLLSLDAIVFLFVGVFRLTLVAVNLGLGIEGREGTSFLSLLKATDQLLAGGFSLKSVTACYASSPSCMRTKP